MTPDPVDKAFAFFLYAIGVFIIAMAVLLVCVALGVVR